MTNKSKWSSSLLDPADLKPGDLLRVRLSKRWSVPSFSNDSPSSNKSIFGQTIVMFLEENSWKAGAKHNKEISLVWVLVNDEVRMMYARDLEKVVV